jgi:hypothetical protein
MRTRSAEREEFLNDILCTFAEGGIQMIGEIIDKDFDANALKYNMVRVRYFDETPDHVVTIETIAKGLSLCRKGPVTYLGRSHRLRLNECYKEMDAGEIDAVDATNIVEIGLFGEIVYS